MDDDEQLVYSTDGPVARLTLNRPHKLNAITQQLYKDLHRGLMRANVDPGVEVIVITGAGRAFCAGGDLAEVNVLHQENRVLDLAMVGDVSSATFRQVENVDKPVIAAVNGLAHAAGAALVLMSDIVIASDRATFRFPEALRGMAEPYATARLGALIGLARARYMVLTCAEIDATTAADWGLVARVVPPDELEAEVQRTVEMILATTVPARTWNKAMFNRMLPPFEARALRMSISDESTEAGTRQFNK